MDKEEKIIKRIFKSIKKLFAFGFFSSPPYFFLALILFLALLFKIFYNFILFEKSTFLFYTNLTLFIALELLILLNFLLIHLRSYEFVKEIGYNKAPEFDKKIKEKNISKKNHIKGTYLEKSLIKFLFFSFYQGVIIIERPLWLIKSILKIIKNFKKNKKQGLKSLFGWVKIYSSKEKGIIYCPFVLAQNKE